MASGFIALFGEIATSDILWTNMRPVHHDSGLFKIHTSMHSNEKIIACVSFYEKSGVFAEDSLVIDLKTEFSPRYFEDEDGAVAWCTNWIQTNLHGNFELVSLCGFSQIPHNKEYLLVRIST